MNRILKDVLATSNVSDSLRQLVPMFQHAHVGLLLTDAALNISDLNATAAIIVSRSHTELIGKPLFDLDAEVHDAAFYRTILTSLRETGCWNGAISNLRPDGNRYPEQISIAAIHAADGRVSHHLVILSDSSQHHTAKEQIRQIAHFDPLTGLPNRFLLSDRLEQAIAANRRANTRLAVCFLDLDAFKHINDSLGHAAGDVLLREVANRILNTLRSTDTVARLGGDEFVILLSGLDSEDECCQTLDRLLNIIAEPYSLVPGVRSEIGASIGVTLFPADDSDGDTLLQHADHAMYAAKHAGKHCYRLFDARMEQRLEARQDTLRRVARALRTEQFELHYQPIVDLRHDKAIGVEGLIRWNHPILGRLSPSEFIPLLEDDETALGIGDWVIREALRQNRIWHEQGVDLFVNINTFAKQLQRPGFHILLAKSIGEIWPAMPPGKLVLDIGEPNTPKALEMTMATIQSCQKLGVSFHIDDFGTGDSALKSLRLLEIDGIKIYQCFVNDMLTDSCAAAVVKGVIELGKAFGLRVIAEGVATAEHASRLRELGCDSMQGFLFGRPMPAPAFDQWLAEYSRKSSGKKYDSYL